METLLQYRHIIDKKTKNIFIDSVKKVLKNIDLSNIGFIGILGSVKKEYSHDIDIMIFPAIDSKIGDSIKAVSKFYEELEKELRNHHERFYPVVSPKKNMQEMIYYLASLQEGGAGLVPIHSLFFTDLKSFKKFNPENFQKEIKKTMITIYGDFNVITKLRNDIPQEKLEPYFWILDFEMSSKIKTFPRHLVRTMSESLFSYLKNKYHIKISKQKLHNLEDIEKELYRILKELDKKVYD